MECSGAAEAYKIMFDQVVTKRCRLSWLTNSSLAYEPKCGGGGRVAGAQPLSTAVHKTGINFGDLTQCLTYGFDICTGKQTYYGIQKRKLGHRLTFIKKVMCHHFPFY